MNLIKLALAQLTSKPLQSSLSIALFALGMSVVSVLIHFERQVQQQFQNNLAGIDLVVGAKGSPMQLILSSVLHADNPTGNIPLHEAEKITNNPMVKSTIPIALGDNFMGYRIVGTTLDYALLYSAELQSGQWYKHSMEVVLGSVVAEKAGLKTGDEFTGVHGFIEHGHSHDDHPYTVKGILKPTGTVIDRLILTPVESVWEVHDETHDDCENHHCEHHHDHHDCEHHDCDHHHDHRHNEQKSEIEIILGKVDRQEELSAHELNLYNRHRGELSISTNTGQEITSLLVFYNTPMAAVMLPRMINDNTSMQAASPAIELNRLMGLLGYGMNLIRGLAWIITLFSGINILILLWSSLSREIHELALLRTLGATKSKAFMLLITEGIVLATCGWTFNIIITRITGIIVAANSDWISINSFPPILKEEILMLVYALIIGIFAALIPAIKAYRTDIHYMLQKL
ncbi:ABC transporter permease [Natronoflexus pectinivorans]|uniref:Putative ABC transport system permease protein n=1 Tax=Natronoflexus pectinivorans TaxID=682526 RepID=A0A4R2GFG9_9BACT|nr:FtsX-like permease family protein [Natronoflexus pectinivorans]TCO06039.1 putative ABC transport system permease protein [Natronoflexus pectinivorans]